LFRLVSMCVCVYGVHVSYYIIINLHSIEMRNTDLNLSSGRADIQ
jgi:hypothetical protein